MFRFKRWHTIKPVSAVAALPTGERIAQIFRPLLALANDESAIQIIREYAGISDAILQSARAYSVEEYLLTIMQSLIQKKQTPLSIKAISAKYRSQYGGDHTAPVTNKWIGGIIRSRLHITTVKRNGVYILPETEQPRIQALFKRFNINQS